MPEVTALATKHKVKLEKIFKAFTHGLKGPNGGLVYTKWILFCKCVAGAACQPAGCVRGGETAE